MNSDDDTLGSLLEALRRCLKSGTIAELPDGLPEAQHAVSLWRNQRETEIARLRELTHNPAARDAWNRRRDEETQLEHAELDARVHRWNLEHDANVLLRRKRR